MSLTEERGLFYIALGNGRPPTLATKMSLQRRGLIRLRQLNKRGWMLTDAGHRALDGVVETMIRAALSKPALVIRRPKSRRSKRGRS
jgi:hypothetical protein